MKLIFEIDQNNVYDSVTKALDLLRTSNIMTTLPNAKIKIEVISD